MSESLLQKAMREGAEADFRDRTIFDEAEVAVSGPREHDYGKPIDNHTATAQLWTVWFKRKYNLDVPFTWHDVCMLNVLQKISREANMMNRDNWVDICGFTRNIELCDEST